MSLPKDPYMLLSTVNTKLRDKYKSLDDMCEDVSENIEELSAALEKIGYKYDSALNQFVSG